MMGEKLIIVFVMTMIIHTAETLSYSIRLAGVRVNKIAVALSLTGIVVLVSRTANLIQVPVAAKFVDFAKTNVSFQLLNNLRTCSCRLFDRICGRMDLASAFTTITEGMQVD